MRVNYVVATWGGHRRSTNNNEASYLIENLTRLRHLKSSITQITVAHAYNTPILKTKQYEPDYYRNFLDDLRRVDTVDVIDFMNDKKRASYLGLEETVKKYGDSFDYYIFIEDDYFFVQDNFDTILIEMLKEKEVDYLCSWFMPDWFVPQKRSGSNFIVSNGIFKSEALLYLLGIKRGMYSIRDIVKNLHSGGFSIGDFSDKYKVPMWYCKKLVEYSDEPDDYLIVPWQMKDDFPIIKEGS